MAKKKSRKTVSIGGKNYKEGSKAAIAAGGSSSSSSSGTGRTVTLKDGTVLKGEAAANYGRGSGEEKEQTKEQVEKMTEAEFETLLDGANLSPDQEELIRAAYQATAAGDADRAKRLVSAMAAATQFSDPYFKAQVRIATDALERGFQAKEGDLAFQETQLANTLKELQTSTAASKDLLSFEQQQELQQLATKYGVELESTRNTMAATGFTASSKRARAEQILEEQNEGLVESSNRQYSYKVGNYNENLANAERDTAAKLDLLRRQNEEGKLNLLRSAEAEVGSTALKDLGYDNLLGGLSGEISRRRATDAIQFASNFVN